MADKREIITHTFQTPIRAGFLNVIEARRFKENGLEKGDPRYDASFMIPKDSADLVKVKEIAIKLAQENNPGKKLVARRLTSDELAAGTHVEIHVPWTDGDKAADTAKKNGKDQEFFRGNTVLKVSSKFPPVLSAIENKKIVEFNDPQIRAAQSKLFYNGAYFFPYVGFNVYKAKGDPDDSNYKPGGVSLFLNALMFSKHGERIGGRAVSSAEVFKGHVGHEVQVDPGSNDTEEF